MNEQPIPLGRLRLDGISQTNRGDGVSKPAPRRIDSPRISTRTMMSASDDGDPIPCTSLDLSNDPTLAARAMIVRFEGRFLADLMDELAGLLVGVIPPA
jgi:hypothetical protein